MNDTISNLWNPAEFVKAMADLEHDDPAQATTFRRDQHLTPAALFKAKVLAVLNDERRQWTNAVKDSIDAAIVKAIIAATDKSIRRIEAIQP